MNKNCLLCSEHVKVKTAKSGAICESCLEKAKREKRFESLGGKVHLGSIDRWIKSGRVGWTKCGKEFALSSRDHLGFDLTTRLSIWSDYKLKWRPTGLPLDCAICRPHLFSLNRIDVYVERGKPIERNCNICVFNEFGCNLKCWEVSLDRGFVPMDWKNMVYVRGNWYKDYIGKQ